MHPRTRSSSRTRFPLPTVLPRAMTRCECLGVSFEEVARRMAASHQSLEHVMDDTGIGGYCTACVPDLRDYVARARKTAV